MKRCLLLLLASCNAAFGIEPTALVDSPTDSDHDGIDDALDNCPMIANSNQGDDDRDRIGNACDNCPVVANADQAVDVQDPELGVACDPHPGSAGDCVVLYDSFDQPDAFAANWTVIQSARPATLTPGNGVLHIEPDTAGGYPITVIINDAAGPQLDGVFDVEVAGRVTTTLTGSLIALSNASGQTDGYECGVMGSSGAGTVGANDGVNGQGAVIPMSTADHLNSNLLLRLVSPLSPSTEVGCQIAYGIAVGYSTFSTPYVLVGGRPGIRALVDVADIDGFAVYHYQPGVPCAPPIIR